MTSLQSSGLAHESALRSPNGILLGHVGEREWFALFTLPQNEKSVAKYLTLSGFEVFLPTYQVERLWKNRQRRQIVLPLFPTYLFIHIAREQRYQVLNVPGVIAIVGNSRGPIPMARGEIELLRSDLFRSKAEPFDDLATGQRVRIRCGPLSGVEGILIRKKGALRFVLTVHILNVQASIEVDASDVDPLYN